MHSTQISTILYVFQCTCIFNWYFSYMNKKLTLFYASVVLEFSQFFIYLETFLLLLSFLVGVSYIIWLCRFAYRYTQFKYKNLCRPTSIKDERCGSHVRCWKFCRGWNTECESKFTSKTVNFGVKIWKYIFRLTINPMFLRICTKNSEGICMNDNPCDWSLFTTQIQVMIN